MPIRSHISAHHTIWSRGREWRILDLFPQSSCPLPNSCLPHFFAISRVCPFNTKAACLLFSGFHSEISRNGLLWSSNPHGSLKGGNRLDSNSCTMALGKIWTVCTMLRSEPCFLWKCSYNAAGLQQSGLIGGIGTRCLCFSATVFELSPIHSLARPTALMLRSALIVHQEKQRGKAWLEASRSSQGSGRPRTSACPLEQAQYPAAQSLSSCCSS